jgi:multicomponent Na+:H+ antiporter subunit C
LTSAGFVIYATAGVALIGAGAFGLARARDALRRIVAINVAALGVLTTMVALAARGGGEADPVTHAMVLTGLVVSASATALALALVRRMAHLRGEEDADGHDG